MLKKILITGASGFIGRALVQRIRESGYSVVKTTRNPASQEKNVIYWNPDHDEIPIKAFEGLEGIIHLAGENIASFRWTQKKKKRIFLSRVRGTWLLSHALLRVTIPPRFFFSASAIGYYGNRGDELLTEKSRQGSGFLADVCRKWEEASEILKQKGVRIIHGRFGHVLDPSGGMLQKMLPLVRLGLGAQMGDGHQWISWISREDLMRAIEWMLFSYPMEGIVNCTSPNPITQKEWVKALAKAVHRPAFLKIPTLFVHMIFGQMGEELFLSSIRAKPQKLIESGFEFNQPLISNLCSKLSF